MTTIEEWADSTVAGIRVSSLGRLQGRTGRIVAGWVDGRGYRRFNAVVSPLVNRSFRVHTEVLLAFHGPKMPGQVGRHLNGVPLDNRAENLAWGTPTENAQDALRHGHHRNARKTHCIRNHPLSGDNVYVTRAGVRQCIACRNARRRAYENGPPSDLREWANAQGLAFAPRGRIPNAVHEAWQAKCDEGAQR